MNSSIQRNDDTSDFKVVPATTMNAILGFKDQSNPDAVDIQVGLECPECKLVNSFSFDNQAPHINGNFLAKTIQCTSCKYTHSLTITLA